MPLDAKIKTHPPTALNVTIQKSLKIDVKIPFATKVFHTSNQVFWSNLDRVVSFFCSRDMFYIFLWCKTKPAKSLFRDLFWKILKLRKTKGCNTPSQRKFTVYKGFPYEKSFEGSEKKLKFFRFFSWSQSKIVIILWNSGLKNQF